MAEELKGIGDNPKKGIYGPGREEAKEANKSSGNEVKRGLFNSKWWGKALLGGTAVAGTFMGASRTSTGPSEALAQQPPAIITPDLRGPSPAESLGIDIPPLSIESTSSASSHRPMVIETKDQNVLTSDVEKKSDFTRFEAVGFSDDEHQVFQNVYEQSLAYFQNKYGPDIIDKRILFIKAESRPPRGHGWYTNYRYPATKSDPIEFQITEVFSPHMNGEINDWAIREALHNLSHLIATNNIAPGHKEDPQGRVLPALIANDARVMQTVSEGIAEADAHDIDKIRGRFNREESLIDKFLTEWKDRRQNRDIEKPFGSDEDYAMAAAAILALEEKFPHLRRTIIDTYRQSNKINPDTGQNYSPGSDVIFDRIDKYYEKQGRPGFKEALAKEPALRYLPPQPPSPP